MKKFFLQTRQFLRALWNRRHIISDLMKHKHRFVVLDTDTYKEKISFQLSGVNVFVFLGITSLVLVFLTGLLLAFTPLRELIPGYTNPRMVRQTYENARIIDSLETQLKAQEEMLSDIKAIMLGNDPAELHTKPKVSVSDSVKPAPKQYVRSREDTMLREEVERKEGLLHNTQ